MEKIGRAITIARIKIQNLLTIISLYNWLVMQRDKIDALHHKALLRESFLRRLSIGPVT